MKAAKEKLTLSQSDPIQAVIQEHWDKLERHTGIIDQVISEMLDMSKQENTRKNTFICLKQCIREIITEKVLS